MKIIINLLMLSALFIALPGFLINFSQNPIANNDSGNFVLIDIVNNQISDDVDIIYPNGGEKLSGVVNIRWVLSDELSLDSPGYSVYFSPDGGTNWIQLAFFISETRFSWNTTLYEEYGTNYLIKVVVTSKNLPDLIGISENTFIIDNREGVTSIPNTIDIFSQAFIFIAILVVIFFLGYLIFITKIKSKRNPSLETLISHSKTQVLKILREKLIIGIDKVSSEISSDITHLPTNTKEHVSIIEYFPIDIQNNLRSEIKGRTVLTLIEIAYQDPIETNPSKLAENLNIPLPTLSKEIKKLVDLNYVHSFVSNQVLHDGRYRNFSITPRGLNFLTLLNEVLRHTINKVQDNGN